ncbi:hypothetical protein MKX03_004424 [Papaver bracteatum]|nr:hypothetical protein MKX03_004424 [Papaver bracteatum]
MPSQIGSLSSIQVYSLAYTIGFIRFEGDCVSLFEVVLCSYFTIQKFVFVTSKKKI